MDAWNRSLLKMNHSEMHKENPFGLNRQIMFLTGPRLHVNSCDWWEGRVKWGKRGMKILKKSNTQMNRDRDTETQRYVQMRDTKAVI